MLAPFANAYPHLAAFVQRQGWLEMGYDDFNRSFIRIIDLGGMVWEGETAYDTLDGALAEADAAAASWFEENT